MIPKTFPWRWVGYSLGGVALVALGWTIRNFYVAVTTLPPKPVFKEELPKPSPPPKTASPTKPAPPKPKPSAPPKPPVDPNAFKARVTWPEGLAMRLTPEEGAEVVGGVEGNAEVLVLRESQDKAWQLIRIPGTNQEGWVRAGNLEPLP